MGDFGWLSDAIYFFISYGVFVKQANVEFYSSSSFSFVLAK